MLNYGKHESKCHVRESTYCPGPLFSPNNTLFTLQSKPPNPLRDELIEPLIFSVQCALGE
jgi:hypothetical protein